MYDAKELANLYLKLTVPDEYDDLILSSDASKIAASAFLGGLPCMKLYPTKTGKYKYLGRN